MPEHQVYAGGPVKPVYPSHQWGTVGVVGSEKRIDLILKEDIGISFIMNCKIINTAGYWMGWIQYLNGQIKIMPVI